MQRQRHSPDDRPPLEVHGLGLVPSKCRRRRTSSQLAFPPKRSKSRCFSSRHRHYLVFASFGEKFHSSSSPSQLRDTVFASATHPIFARATHPIKLRVADAADISTRFVFSLYSTSVLNYSASSLRFAVDSSPTTPTLISGNIVIGYDEGTIMVKRGREVPVANMDNSGKIF
ncbi:hypothetical protein Ahy_A06g027764 isoform B [Arachis hypogaea]|uniref:Uncharacterized protein n=1 Tax=Arachis hypogaea TaxID=3818 RepID=A0A445CPN1_ARAHY|nr:hypothetical protein Ahy_A06g027764 isoform A [Arachis hypogaea]RYR52902.1 hypothetical protein Ahy_A06g027764 isoform B [Arachis hypogaea]